MTVLLLTGPPASGKNTIAASLAASIGRLAVVDVDVLRQMVLQPHRAPWDGDEGRAQQALGVHNACLLARSFEESGYHVVILDVPTGPTLERYRAELSIRVVRLMPSWIETERRSSTRNEQLTQRERRMLYDQQQALLEADETIDNSRPTAEAVAEHLRTLLVEN